MTADLVRIERHGDGGHVAELVLDRPGGDERGLHRDGAAPWPRPPTELAQDPEVRAVVVSSSHPKAFCVGADLKERNSFTDDDLRAQRPLAQAAYRGVLDLPVPAIAAVDGYALGGGFEIALSCDLVVCGEDAVVGLPEVSVGRHPRWRRHPAAHPPGGLVARGADDLHGPALPGRGRLPARRRRRGGAGGLGARPRARAGDHDRQPTRRSGCATPRPRCGRVSTPTWPPDCASRTTAGPPRPSPQTALRGSPRSTRNAVLTGLVAEKGPLLHTITP